MGYKVFLDINIVVDFLDETRKENALAIKLFEEIEKTRVHGFLSESVVNTTSYLLRKALPVEFFKIMVNDLISFVKVLPCSNMIIQEAYKNAKNDLEDSVLYQIALQHKLDYFVTSDSKDYKKISHPSLPVVSSKKILEIINHE